MRGTAQTSPPGSSCPGRRAGPRRRSADPGAAGPCRARWTARRWSARRGRGTASRDRALLGSSTTPSEWLYAQNWHSPQPAPPGWPLIFSVARPAGPGGRGRGLAVPLPRRADHRRAVHLARHGPAAPGSADRRRGPARRPGHDDPGGAGLCRPAHRCWPARYTAARRNRSPGRLHRAEVGSNRTGSMVDASGAMSGGSRFFCCSLSRWCWFTLPRADPVAGQAALSDLTCAPSLPAEPAAAVRAAVWWGGCAPRPGSGRSVPGTPG